MSEQKILLVDDEPFIRRSMQKTLLRAGYNVKIAGDVTEGLQTFEDALGSKASFDLAVLDLNMPGFDGIPRDGAGLELL